MFEYLVRGLLLVFRVNHKFIALGHLCQKVFDPWPFAYVRMILLKCEIERFLEIIMLMNEHIVQAQNESLLPFVIVVLRWKQPLRVRDLESALKHLVNVKRWRLSDCVR